VILVLASWKEWCRVVFSHRDTPIHMWQKPAALKHEHAPSTRMNPVPIIPARLDWPSAIGNFLLNYGTLDYFVFCFLKDHLSVEEFAKVKEWHLKNRLDRIAQHLQEKTFPAEQQKEFAQLVTRLEPIRELRNHIAHGHMYCRIDEVTKQLAVTLFKAKDVDTGFEPGAKHVEFPELLTALSTLRELTEGFERLAGFIEEGHAPS
jgi:hypothetical protein